MWANESAHLFAFSGLNEDLRERAKLDWRVRDVDEGACYVSVTGRKRFSQELTERRRCCGIGEVCLSDLGTCNGAWGLDRHGDGDGKRVGLRLSDREITQAEGRVG